LQGLFTIKLTTEGLRIKFFIAGILLLKGSLYRGFSVLRRLYSMSWLVEMLSKLLFSMIDFVVVSIMALL
jgi:hypothetical protein